MAKELDDLNAAVTSMADAVVKATDEMKTELAMILVAVSAPAGIDPVAVEDAAMKVSALADQLSKAVADVASQVPA